MSGKNVNPTTKLASQLVDVASPLPRDRTLRGNNSLCIQGTLPRPRAYEAVKRSMLVKIIKGAPPPWLPVVIADAGNVASEEEEGELGDR